MWNISGEAGLGETANDCAKAENGNKLYLFKRSVNYSGPKIMKLAHLEDINLFSSSSSK